MSPLGDSEFNVDRVDRPKAEKKDVGSLTTTTSSPLVYVIDDDASLLRALRRLLAAGGFRVCTFSSAEDFLESATMTPACLVLDVHLGGLSGLDLQEHLLASGRKIPVVFITAHDDALTRERAQRAGAVDYLRKPFNDELLIAGIQRALDTD
jgi:FixJ family two-component response regulator